jgi:hypothetical protein
MSRALRYLPERQMSSIDRYHDRYGRVPTNVPLLPGFWATFRGLAGRSPLFPEKG